MEFSKILWLWSHYNPRVCTFVQPNHYFIKENAPACNQLLFDNHRWCMETVDKDHDMPHFFNDILSLNCSGTFRDKDSYQTKRRKICGSVLLPTQLCNTHSHTDSESDWCMVPSPDYGCSGLPCTDMSRAGRQLKKHGPTNSVYMTHGKYVENKKVPIFTVECTPESWLSTNNNNCLIF